MLYQLPSRSRRILNWLARALRPGRPFPVTDARELGPYLQADIGISDQSLPFRRGR